MFFFASTKQRIKSQFADLFPNGGGGTKAAKAVGETYGWSLIIYRLAKSELFSISTKTNKQAAEDADLYEAFHFLASENALAKLEQETK
jgi:hypothetical protein